MGCNPLPLPIGMEVAGPKQDLIFNGWRPLKMKVGGSGSRVVDDELSSLRPFSIIAISYLVGGMTDGVRVFAETARVSQLLH